MALAADDAEPPLTPDLPSDPCMGPAGVEPLEPAGGCTAPGESCTDPGSSRSPTAVPKADLAGRGHRGGRCEGVSCGSSEVPRRQRRLCGEPPARGIRWSWVPARSHIRDCGEKGRGGPWVHGKPRPTPCPVCGSPGQRVRPGPREDIGQWLRGPAETARARPRGPSSVGGCRWFEGRLRPEPRRDRRSGQRTGEPRAWRRRPESTSGRP